MFEIYLITNFFTTSFSLTMKEIFIFSLLVDCLGNFFSYTKKKEKKLKLGYFFKKIIRKRENKKAKVKFTFTFFIFFIKIKKKLRNNRNFGT